MRNVAKKVTVNPLKKMQDGSSPETKFLDSAICKRTLAYDVEHFKTKISRSYVHRKIAKEIYDSLAEYTHEYSGSYIRNVMEVNDSCIEELEDITKFESMKVLGFELTYSNVNNALVAFVSIALTLYEIFSG